MRLKVLQKQLWPETHGKGDPVQSKERKRHHAKTDEPDESKMKREWGRRSDDDLNRFSFCHPSRRAVEVRSGTMRVQWPMGLYCAMETGFAQNCPGFNEDQYISGWCWTD